MYILIYYVWIYLIIDSSTSFLVYSPVVICPCTYLMISNAFILHTWYAWYFICDTAYHHLYLRHSVSLRAQIATHSIMSCISKVSRFPVQSLQDPPGIPQLSASETLQAVMACRSCTHHANHVNPLFLLPLVNFDWKALPLVTYVMTMFQWCFYEHSWLILDTQRGHSLQPARRTWQNTRSLRPVVTLQSWPISWSPSWHVCRVSAYPSQKSLHGNNIKQSST